MSEDIRADIKAKHEAVQEAIREFNAALNEAHELPADVVVDMAFVFATRRWDEDGSPLMNVLCYGDPDGTTPPYQLMGLLEHGAMAMRHAMSAPFHHEP